MLACSTVEQLVRLKMGLQDALCDKIPVVYIRVAAHRTQFDPFMTFMTLKKKQIAKFIFLIVLLELCRN